MMRTMCCESFVATGVRRSICPERPENALDAGQCQALLAARLAAESGRSTMPTAKKRSQPARE
jgi:hypothetical protein